MDERHTLSALTMQLALAGDLCALVYLFTLRSGEVGRYYPLVLLAYAPAIYGLDRLFLRSSRTMRGLILLNGVMGIGLFLSVCMVDGWKSWETMIFAGAFCLWPTVQAGKIALEPPKLHSMILCLDTSTIVLALFVSFLSAVGLPAYWSVPAAAGCAAAVLGTISLRINRSMGPRDWGVVLLAFGARLRLRVFLWRERNTPRGLFCLLVHRCRMGPWHKRPEETPREFLTRLQESAWDDGELSTALGELIPAVDRALYAPDCSGGPVPGARLIRRRISTAVHRQFLRDCWAKVRTLRRVLSEG